MVKRALLVLAVGCSSGNTGASTPSNRTQTIESLSRPEWDRMCENVIGALELTETEKVRLSCASSTVFELRNLGDDVDDAGVKVHCKKEFEDCAAKGTWTITLNVTEITLGCVGWKREKVAVNRRCKKVTLAEIDACVSETKSFRQKDLVDPCADVNAKTKGIEEPSQACASISKCGVDEPGNPEDAERK